jgi:hypothetical protein
MCLWLELTSRRIGKLAGDLWGWEYIELDFTLCNVKRFARHRNDIARSTAE